MRRPPRHAAAIASLTVGKDDPKVLQDFLSQRFSLSRRTAKAIVDGRSVWVNRKCIWMARHELGTGDVVEIPSSVVNGAIRQSAASRAAAGAPADAGPRAGKPAAVPRRHVRVLWQDDSYLVCDKPAGIVSCDDQKSAESILREQENVPTLEAVHRLDRDTTGCLLFAKNRRALEAAIEVFKTHNVKKTYNAVVAGRFKFARQTIDSPIDSQNAVTRVAREAVGDDASFLRVRIDTGRTNQIRRHLASIRFPIVGDRVFGLKSARDPKLMRVPRQMLHASSLELPHPLKPKETIKAHSPLPADFRSALALFGMGK